MDINEKLDRYFLKRPKAIKQTGKIVCGDTFYLNVIHNYVLTELTPDIILDSYEHAILINRAYVKDYGDSFSEKYWIIASSGQGEIWLINDANEVLWFDHDLGEFDDTLCVNFKMSFSKLLDLGFLLLSYHDELEKQPNYLSSTEKQTEFINRLNLIQKDLYAIYPYRYFTVEQH